MKNRKKSKDNNFFEELEKKTYNELNLMNFEELTKEDLKKVENIIIKKRNIINNLNIDKPWYYNDLGGLIPFNQSRCAKFIKDKYKIIYFGDFYIFKNMSYEKISKQELTYIMMYELNIEESQSNFEGVIKLLASISLIKDDDINKNKQMIIFKNKAISINKKTAEIKEFNLTCNDYYTVKMNATYNIQNKNIDLWQKYLNDVLPEKPQQLVLQEFLGLCLYPEIIPKKFLYMFGKKNSGKSIILNIMSHIFNNHYTSLAINEMDDRFNKILLKDSRINICGEIIDNIEKSVTLKKAVGRDPIQGEVKGLMGVPFRTYAKFIFATNKLLRLCGDTTDGMYERFLYIHFKKSIPKEKQVDGLEKEIIEKEIEGIVNWLIEGLKRYILNKDFTKTTEQTKLLNEQKNVDSTIVKFVGDECIIDNNVIIYRSKLFEKFKEYCKENNFKDTSAQTFKTELLKYYEEVGDYDDKKKKIEGNIPAKVFTGIRLINSSDVLAIDNDIDKKIIINIKNNIDILFDDDLNKFEWFIKSVYEGYNITEILAYIEQRKNNIRTNRGTTLNSIIEKNNTKIKEIKCFVVDESNIKTLIPKPYKIDLLSKNIEDSVKIFLDYDNKTVFVPNFINSDLLNMSKQTLKAYQLDTGMTFDKAKNVLNPTI